MIKLKYKIKESIKKLPNVIGSSPDTFEYMYTAGGNRGATATNYRTMEEDADSCVDEYGVSPSDKPDENEDGAIDPDELYYHFDLNQDKTVSPEEYEEHVKWHARNPEVFNSKLTYSLTEKKDRCYHLAKRKYDVFPSAYASGFIVRCRKGKVAKKKNEELEINENKFNKEKESGLHGWFQRQGGKGKSKGWVDCNTCRTDKKTGRKTCKTCGRQDGESRSKYPACRPTPSACTRKGTSSKKSSQRVSWKSKSD